MRRVEPAFPDLLPITHRIGGQPSRPGAPVLDPVEMRLRWSASPVLSARRGGPLPSRPVRALVHAAALAEERQWLTQFLEAGNGLLVVWDGDGSLDTLPEPRLVGQVVVVTPLLPSGWGGSPVRSLQPFLERGLDAGVLLALAPVVRALEEVDRSVMEGLEAGAQFIAAIPLALPPGDCHRLYESLAGEEGDGELENLLFHSDHGSLTEVMERDASRLCARAGVDEFIPAPATATSPQRAARALSQLLLWARRLDLLDGSSSPGWQLRRAAWALRAAGKDPLILAAEDNLRIVPGFDPWVEAFTRSLWQGGGEPFDSIRERWLAA